MMWWDNDPGWGGWVLMTVMMVLFWGALIVGGVAIWRAVTRDEDRRTEAQKRPEQILDERYARGEIDEDDYRRRRELLHTGP